MELTDLLPDWQWAALEMELHEGCGMNVHVYNKAGKYVTSYNSWANELCPMIRSTPQGISAICSTAQQALTVHAQKTRKAAVSECDAGFAKFLIPIYHGDEFLGSIGACGYLPTGSEIEYFLLSKTTGKDEAELRQNAAGIKEIRPEEIEKWIKLFQQSLKEKIPGL